MAKGDRALRKKYKAEGKRLGVKPVRTPKAAREYGRKWGAQEMANESTSVDEPWTEESINDTHRTLRKANWDAVRRGHSTPYAAVMANITARAATNEMLRQVRARPERPTVAPKPDWS